MKPIAGEHGDADDVAPAERRVELGAGEPGDQPAAAEDADRLADHQAEDHADHHRVAHQLTAAGRRTTPADISAKNGTARPDDSGESRCSSRSAGLARLARVAAHPRQQAAARRRRWWRGRRSRAPPTRPRTRQRQVERPASRTRRRWSTAHAANAATASATASQDRCSASV